LDKKNKQENKLYSVDCRCWKLEIGFSPHFFQKLFFENQTCEI
jgi:hypothetical protein